MSEEDGSWFCGEEGEEADLDLAEGGDYVTKGGGSYPGPTREGWVVCLVKLLCHAY